MAKTIKGIKAGTTRITASFTDGGVTKTSYVDFTVSKIDASLTFAVNSTALTYNGAAQLLGTVSYTGDGQAKYYVSTSNSAPSASASGWVNCSNGTQVKATNVGTYYVFLQASAGTNYNAVAVKAGNTTGKVISQKTVTVTAPSASKTYDGAALTKSSGATLSGQVSGHTLNSCTLTGTITNVGSADNIASNAKIYSGSTDVTSNYSISYAKGTLTVSARAITFTADNQSWTYDGATHSASNTATKTAGNNLVSGHTASFTCTGSVGATVGTATKTLSGVTIMSGSTNVTSNYSITKNNGTLTVSKRPVTYTATNQSKQYDGSKLNADNTATLTSGSLVSGHSATITGSGSTSATTAGSTGTKTISVVIKSGSTDVSSNYAITTVNGTLSITARTVTYKADNQSWTYDGSTHSASNTATLTSGTLLSGHSATFSCSGSVGATVGSATKTLSSVTIKDSSNNDVSSNYSITKSNGTLSITARTVTYKADNQSWTYDGSTHSASNTATLTSGTLPTGHTATFSCTGSVGANVGTATKTLNGVTIKNSGGTDVSSSFTITKNNGTLTVSARAITFTATNESWVYDAASHSASNTAAKTGGNDLVSGHTASFTCTGSVGATVGTATKTLSGVTIMSGSTNVTSNYSITKNNGTLTVSKRPIKVTAGSNSKTYDGTALTYNSATAESTGTNRGLVSGHSMTSCTVTGSQTTYGSSNNVPSAAVIKSGTTDVTSNYNISYVNGTLTVNKCAVTYTADNQTWTYDGATHSASNTATKTGGTLPTGHTATFSCTGSVGANVGSATKTLSTVVIKNSGGTDVSGSFTITKNNGTLSITARSTTVTAGSTSKTYDGTALTYNNASASNLVSGHTMTCTVTGTQTLAGSSNNVPSAAVLKDGNGTNVTSNYSISYTNGTLTVNKRAVTYTANNESWTYNGSSHSASNTATLTSGSLPSNHTATITCGGSITYVGTATKTISVVIKNGSGTDVSSSFTITPTTGILTVTKATPTITVTGVSQTYNNTTYYAKVTKSDAKGTLYWKYGSAPTTSSYGGTTDISSVGTPVGNPSALSTPINITSVKNVTNQTLYWIFVPSSSATITTNQTYAANFNNSASGSVTMKITAAAVTIPTPTGYTGTYDANNHSATFPTVTGATITAWQKSLDGGSTWTDMTSNPIRVSAGTILSRAYYTADSNHSIGGTTGGSTWSSNATIKINQKAVTVTAGSASRAYNGSALTKADGTTASGLITGHSLTSYTNTGSQTYVGSSNNVPSAAVIKDGDGNIVTSNYAITYANGSLTISKATPVVTVTGITADYTGGSFYATAKANAIGTLYWKKGAVASVSSNDGSVKLSTLNTNANVTFVKDNSDDFVMYWYFVPSSSDNITSGQTYAANFNNAGGGSSDKVNLTINPRSISNVTASATAVTYNGSQQTATVSISDSGGNLTSNDYTISGNTGTNATNYTITITGRNNYTGTKTITWTINKRAVTITAGSDSKTYDGTALTKNTVSASAQSGNTGMISSHHIHSWTVSGSQTIAGSSNNVVSAATIYNGTHSGTESDVSSNYTITFAKGTLTVNTRTVTATATDQTKVYNGSKLTATNTGTVTNLPSNHTITYSCTGEIGPGVSSGTKTLSSVVIKNSGGTDVTSSFAVTKKNGTLSITNATITYANTSPVSEYCTLTATATNKTLGNVTIPIGSASATDYNGTAITSGSNPSVEGYTISQSGWSISSDGKTITVPANVDAGTYNITVTASKPNHTPKTNGIAVTLTAVVLSTLTLTPHTNTIPYGGTTEVDQVKATYSNGKWKDVKGDATYTTNPTGIITIS